MPACLPAPRACAVLCCALHACTGPLALAHAGDGWSPRLEDAVLHGCVPVIIMDNVHVSFESVIDYASFAIRINETQLEQVRWGGWGWGPWAGSDPRDMCRAAARCVLVWGGRRGGPHHATPSVGSPCSLPLPGWLIRPVNPDDWDSLWETIALCTTVLDQRLEVRFEPISVSLHHCCLPRPARGRCLRCWSRCLSTPCARCSATCATCGTASRTCATRCCARRCSRACIATSKVGCSLEPPGRPAPLGWGAPRNACQLKQTAKWGVAMSRSWMPAVHACTPLPAPLHRRKRAPPLPPHTRTDASITTTDATIKVNEDHALRPPPADMRAHQPSDSFSIVEHDIVHHRVKERARWVPAAACKQWWQWRQWPCPAWTHGAPCHA